MTEKQQIPIGSPMFHLKNVLSLTIITGFMTFFLLGIYYLTYEAPDPKRDILNLLKDDGTKFDVTLGTLSLDDVKVIAEETGENVDSYFDHGDIETFYVKDIATDTEVMTIYKMKSGGFGGLVTTLVGVSDSKVALVSVTDASTETAGLGQRVAERAFQRQFIGLSEEQIPIERTEWVRNDLTAISGATFSSQAVSGSIHKSLIINKLGGNDAE